MIQAQLRSRIRREAITAVMPSARYEGLGVFAEPFVVLRRVSAPCAADEVRLFILARRDSYRAKPRYNLQLNSLCGREAATTVPLEFQSSTRCVSGRRPTRPRWAGWPWRQYERRGASGVIRGQRDGRPVATQPCGRGVQPGWRKRVMTSSAGSVSRRVSRVFACV